VLFAAFCLSMLTWIPQTWESVFNAGLAFSTIFLSITLITGMGGQLSLCQAMLAGVGAFTAAQLANHLGLNLLLGGLVGAAVSQRWSTDLASRSPQAWISATSPMRRTITAIMTEVSNRW